MPENLGTLYVFLMHRWVILSTNCRTNCQCLKTVEIIQEASFYNLPVQKTFSTIN